MTDQMHAYVAYERKTGYRMGHVYARSLPEARRMLTTAANITRPSGWRVSKAKPLTAVQYATLTLVYAPGQTFHTFQQMHASTSMSLVDQGYMIRVGADGLDWDGNPGTDVGARPSELGRFMVEQYKRVHLPEPTDHQAHTEWDRAESSAAYDAVRRIWNAYRRDGGPKSNATMYTAHDLIALGWISRRAYFAAAYIEVHSK